MESSSHGSIVIYGDNGFTTESGVTRGSGTAADPFIIEGWSIQVSGTAITIENTTAHFIVRNVNLFRSDSGILIRESANGKVENSTISENTFWGIAVTSSRNITVSGNDVSLNGGGITVGWSTNLTIHDNKVAQNGGRNSNAPTGISMYSAVNNTRVFHNRIVDNNYQQAYDSGENAWDNGYPDGGNLWSDYEGVDNCGGPNQTVCWIYTTSCTNPATGQGCTTQQRSNPDGVGDAPYIIDSNSMDRYPLLPTVQNAPPFYYQAWFPTAIIVVAGAVAGLLFLQTRRRKRPHSPTENQESRS